jgi:hypothetical protein
MPKLSTGGIWQGVLAALRPDFGIFFALVAPFTLLVSMGLALLGPPPPKTLADFTPQVVLVLLLIPSIIGALAQLALTFLIATPGSTPGRALAAAAKVLPAYLAAVLIITPVTTLGFLLLIVPGLYLFARLFLMAPVVVIEGLGPVAALRRSWALTADSGWTITLFLALALLFVFGASILASGVGAALASLLTLMGLQAVGGFVAALIGAVVSTLFTMGSAAAGTVIFQRLR